MMAVARVIRLIGLMLLALGCTELPVESDQGLTADASSDKADCVDVEDCVPDCLGQWGGNAFIDACGQCVGGTSDAEACRCGDGQINVALSETCDDGNEVTEVCPYGVRECLICDENCQEQSGAVEFCGDGVVQEDRGEVCDDGNLSGTDYCSADCGEVLSVCGDGEQAADEACDDGNTSDGDYCAADCQAITTLCGDGQVQGQEACDDGNQANGDYCSADCSQETSICGDGRTEREEMCDDGNTITELCAYGLAGCTVCSATCQYEAGARRYCGDGIIQPEFESCDEPPLEGSCDYGPATCFGCSAQCEWQAVTPRYCGDGVVDPEEECDDGNAITESCTYGEEDCTVCNYRCRLESFVGSFCGNGQLEADEVCDDGNQQDGDYCAAGCDAVTTICGDGFREGNEVCDDGNASNDDYCSADCREIQTICGDGRSESPETCDDGNRVTESCIYGQTSCDICDADCQLVDGATAYCGDGRITDGEVCDDGNTSSDDYCASDCNEVTGSCGDGVVQTGVEECDDAADGGDSECRSDCNFTFCGDGVVNRDEVCDDGDNRLGVGPCNQTCTAIRECEGPWSQLGNCSTGWGIYESWDRFLSAGLNHACGVIYDGGVYCWGDNAAGQTNVPDDLNPSVGVAAGAEHSCSVDIAGAVRCWGAQSNSGGGTQTVIGVGFSSGPVTSSSSGSASVTTVPSDLPPAIWVSAGGDATCAILRDQSVRCWGDTTYGQTTVPSDLGPVRSLSVGSQHVCAAQVEGNIRCWGDNTYGQLNVPADLGNVLQVKSGGFHSCAVDGDSLRCWGRDDNGQLGPITFTESDHPGASQFFSTGFDFACGLSKSTWSGRGHWQGVGSQTCTGSNSYGQHGPRRDPYEYEAVLSSMASGSEFTCWIQNKGTLECYGNNGFGIREPSHLTDIRHLYNFHTLGDLVLGPNGSSFGDDILAQTTLTEPGSDLLLGIERVSGIVGAWENYLVLNDGQFLTGSGPGFRSIPATPWFLGPIKRLGGRCIVTTNDIVECRFVDDPFSDPYGALEPPSDLPPALDVQSPGTQHTCMLGLDGSVHCWGRAIEGQIDVPTDLGPATAIALGDTGTCALLTDGTTRCWGTNTDRIDRPVAVAVDTPPTREIPLQLGYENVPWGYTITGEYQFERICPEGQFYRSVLKENARPSDLREFRCVVDENLPLGPRADGTYVDDRGLMWMRCAQGMTWDAASQSCTESAETFEYCLDALTSCTAEGGTHLCQVVGDQLNYGTLRGTGDSPLWDSCNDLDFAGYTDWRVPSIYELSTILYCSNGHEVPYSGCREYNNAYDYVQPTLDPEIFGSVTGDGIWSSTPAGYGPFACYLNIWDGVITDGEPSSSLAVFCVR